MKQDLDKFGKLGPILVTGGAGFIGSHLVERFLSNEINVKVLDNLSTGGKSNLARWENHKNFSFIQEDLGNYENLLEPLRDIETIFHFAADPEVRTGFETPDESYRENIRNTFHLLEAARKSNIANFFFTSSSTVYGEPTIMPTPEDYGPLFPISPYGASKLASEALISAYCHNYGMKGQVYRLANVIGSRGTHGVIIDFIKKLNADNTNLEILGDGKQTKSYLHVSDCVDAILLCALNAKEKIDVFNIGNDDAVDVMTIANIVCDSMELKNVELTLTGGVDNGRGWIGDVKMMNLDKSKIQTLGWAPKLSSKNAVEVSVKEVLKEFNS